MPLLNLLSQMRLAAKKVLYSGDRRWCPVCEKSARAFRPAGRPTRIDARCPWCNTMERHRLFVLFLQRNTDLLNRPVDRLLHVAPEAQIQKILKPAAGDGYLSADLMSPLAMEKMDITDIRHEDNTFDVIYCSHVLEHVPDDRKAISEFYRVLKPGGWAVLNVPITDAVTFEDPSITDPKDRLRVFGQHDHVRRYGPDYLDRLTGAGFEVTTYTPSQVASAAEVERFGLTPAAGEVIYCTKQGTSRP